MLATQVLALREYERASLGDRWDAERKVITFRDASALELLQAGSAGNMFAIGRRSIKAQNYVGTVCFGSRAIEVLPKIDQDSHGTRRRLVEMLSVSGMLPFREAEVAAQSDRSITVLDAFMKVYLTHLTAQWRRGRITNYRKRDRNRTCLKGKLLFTEQIRRNLLHAERFYSRCDEFTHDVPPSQLLKAAVQVCRRFAAMHTIRRDALSLLLEFDDVTDVGFQPEQLDNVRTDRRSERFAPLIALAKRLVSQQTPDQTGKVETFSLLFDMNAVFESYIAALMRRLVCPPEHVAVPQVKGRHLLLRGTNKKFGLVPDIGVYSRRKLVCLVDTKWKLLDRTASHEGVSQADMYQMYAYAKEYSCPLVILLYPRHTDFESQVASYRLPPGDSESARIEVCTVDVSKPPAAVATELKDLLGRLLPQAFVRDGSPTESYDSPVGDTSLA